VFDRSSDRVQGKLWGGLPSPPIAAILWLTFRLQIDAAQYLAKQCAVGPGAEEEASFVGFRGHEPVSGLSRTVRVRT